MNNQIITLKRVKSWTELPAQGMQSWKPNYASEQDSAIIEHIKNHWLAFGYNYAIMCEDINTLHLFQSM